MSFFALKYRLRYKTCHVAKPNKQHILNILKNSTRLFVFSKIKQLKNNKIINNSFLGFNSFLPFVSRISSSRLRIKAKSRTMESERSSSLFKSTSNGFNLEASAI